MRIILIIFVFCSIEVVAQTTSMNLSDTNSINAIKINEEIITEKPKDKASDVSTFRSEDYAFDGWYNTRSTLVSCLTIFASLVSIFGIGSIWWSIKRQRISRNCQKRIIIDLIRHFIVNAAIVDGVKYMMDKKAMRPEEGVFARLATLDSDMNLERFEINSKNYEKIHNLSLSMRNYNLYVNMVEEHFKQDCILDTKERLYKELQTINKRLCNIVSKLWELQGKTLKHNIAFDDIYSYLEQKYQKDVDKIDDKDIVPLTDIQVPLLINDKMENYEMFYKKYVIHKIKELAFYDIK